MRNILHRVLAIMVVLSFFLTSTPIYAESVPNNEWDGKTALQSGERYTVSRRLAVGGNVTIPANTQISVLNGGELLFTAKSNVNLFGEIMVFTEAELFTSGNFILRESGHIDLYGIMSGSISSDIAVTGSITVYNRGELNTSGAFKLNKDSYIYNRGLIAVLPSGKSTFSGNYTDTVYSTLRIEGELGVSVSGKLVNKGTLTITENGRLLNSGQILLDKDSVFNRFGTYMNTRSGIITDNIGEIDKYLLTSDAIANEPDVFLHGIDVSRYQGDIDWKKVKAAGIEFSIMRIGVGGYTDRNGEYHPDAMDSKFREYIAGAQANDIEVGVYFYSYASTVEGIKREARYLVEILKEFQITYPVALDMEEPPSDYIDDPSEMAAAFLEIVLDAGYMPMIYSYKFFLEGHISAEVRSIYSVWVAHTGVEATNYNGRYYMWQYSHTGKVSGITDNKGNLIDVDLNIAYRDFSEYIRRERLNNLE